MIAKNSSIVADRYVPLRKGTSNDHLSTSSMSTFKTQKASDLTYASMLNEQQRRCLSFSRKKTMSTSACSQPQTSFSNHLKRIKEKKININLVKKCEAFQIIHAPQAIDNYYNHPLDWSVKGKIAVALQQSCHLYSNQIISQIPLSMSRFVNQYSITSVKFNKDGNLLFVGDSEGDFRVVDLEIQKEFRILKPHYSRIGCIENTFEWGVLTGSQDRSISHHDLRTKNSVVMKLIAHKDEVCGLTVQNNKIASGGRDGSVLIWNLNNKSQFQSRQIHKGAVKALKWCPWRTNILGSGGGNSDHKILIWNSQSEQVQQILQGKSQITQLIWRESTKDLITSHGGNRKESYSMIWSSKIKQFTHILTGHKKRIVGLAVSPQDQSKICSLGADQTMRFWNTRNSENINDFKNADRSKTVHSLDDLIFK